MDNLLVEYFVKYINTKRSVYQPCDITITSFRSDVIDNSIFDIEDKKGTIIQPVGTGSATYNNINNKIIAFIDYEDFLNQVPNELIKTINLKKCDFIAYDLENSSFFILNELSKSGKANNKRNDAKLQLSNALHHLMNIPEIRLFINGFSSQKCIFSNRIKSMPTPENIADAFELIKVYLPEPITLNFQPITKWGFELIETSIIDV